MAGMSAAQTLAELQRKRNNNIAPTSAANQQQYNALKPMAATPKPSTQGAVPPTAAVKSAGAVPKTPMAAQPKTTGAIPSMPATPKPVGATPQAYASPTTKGAIPNMKLNNDITALRGGDALSQLASDQLAMQRDSLQNAADTQTASLQNSARYANQLLQDNRVLEDASFARNNSPAAWDGSVGYRGAMLDRGRQIDDTMLAADLSNAINSVRQDLYNFDANAAATERGIANELLNNERNYQGQLFGQAATTADLTGQFTSPEAQQALNTVYELKALAEAPGVTAQERAGYSAQANQARAQLQALGYNTSAIGSGVNLSSARGAANNFGTQTMASQAQDYSQMADTRNFKEGVRQSDRTFEYTAGRDKVADAQWMKQFDEQVKQNGIGNALNWAQNAISRQNANTSSASAANSRNNANFGRLMDIWKATGVAPAGIDGVPEGTPYAPGVESQVPTSKPTKNEIEAEYYTNLDRLNESDLKTFFSKEKANIIADLGKTGYDDLKEAYGIYD